MLTNTIWIAFTFEVTPLLRAQLFLAAYPVVALVAASVLARRLDRGAVAGRDSATA